MVPSGDGWWVDTYRYQNCHTDIDSDLFIRTYTQDTVGRNDCIAVEEFNILFDV